MTIPRQRAYLSLSPPDTPSFYTTFTYAHKQSLGPLKVCMPLTHSRVTVTVFQAKALYGRWTLEYAHYGHRIYILVVIIWYLADDMSPFFVDDTDRHCI